MAVQASSLVAQFDEIVAGVNVLSAGTESAFAEYLTHHIDFFSHQMDGLKSENHKLKGEKEAKDIQLKLSRKSLENQMNENTQLRERLKEYEKQFTILKALLSSDDKLSNLNEAERRSLAMLKKPYAVSPGMAGFLNESGDCGSPSDASINVTDATDLDDDEMSCRATWKRRRTASVEYTLDSSLSKKRKSVEDVLTEKKDSLRAAEQEVHMTSPLDKKFKKPPPNKNRRKPSKGHLVQMKQLSPPVPLLNLPRQEEDSPVPSAPSELEVALVNQGILSPHSPSPNPYSPGGGGTQLSPYYEANPLAPLTPPFSSVATRLYPTLEDNYESEKMCYEDVCAAAPLYQPQPLESRSSSDINLTRKHVFFTKTLMKSEICQVCKKKIGFGRNCSKCKDCRALSHVECKERVPLPCVPNVHTPKKKHKESDLAVFCPNKTPRVPALVIHCIKEIEARGMNQVGIYRIPGSDRSIKELKERMLTARGTPNLEKVDDINVVCGCLKQFFLQLQEPLVTHKLRVSFIQAIESDEMALANILEAVALLPPCNKDTLAFLILHLQKVASHSEANKMPVPCLARVFAPTVIGSSSSAESLFKDIQKQEQVMERLLNISSDYWRQYLSVDNNVDPQSPTPSQNPSSSPSTPLASPSTPELMPIPQSPFLGPCQSPLGGRAIRTPMVTRSSSNLSMAPPSSITRSVKKGSTFFGAIN